MTKIILLLTSCLAVLTNSIMVSNIPHLSAYFGDHSQAIFLSKLFLSAPMIFVALLSPLVGFFIDRFGRKNILIGSLLLYAISGVSGFLLHEFTTLILSRLILGIANAGTITTTATLISDYYIEKEKQKVIRAQAAFMAFSDVLFLNLGDHLSSISWKAPFLMFGLVFLLIPIAATVLQEPVVRQLTKFKVSPLHQHTPKKQLFWIYLSTFTISALCYIIPTQLPFVIAKHPSFVGAKVGLVISITNLTAFLSYFLYRNICSNYKNQTILTGILYTVGTGFFVIYTAKTYWMILLGLMLAGMGIGFMLPNALLWVISIAPASSKGRLIGGLTTAFYLGEFASPLLFQPLISRFNPEELFGFVGISMVCFAVSIMLFQKLSPHERRAEIPLIDMKMRNTAAAFLFARAA